MKNQMSSRTNFVQVSNLPPCYSNGLELLNAFSSCGQVQVRQMINQTEIKCNSTIHNAICPGYYCSRPHNCDRVFCYEVNLKNEISKNLSPKFFRSQSDYAVFALNNISIGGSNVIVTKFIKDNSLPNATLYKNLGQYIGQDHHFMDANSFVPWSPAMTAPGGLVQKSNFRQALTEP